MQPPPLLLYRRRWTLVFMVPCVAVMAVCLAYALFIALTARERVFMAFGWMAAVVMFCLCATLGRMAWQAYAQRDPAVVIDATGILDLRADDPQTIPWDAMEKVQLDHYAHFLRIKLHSVGEGSMLRALVKTVQRWQRLGDAVIDLRGLAYDARQVQRTVQAFQRSAAPARQTRV